MELWPGYVILIREFERETLLCCELTFKIIRKQTIRSVMCSIYRYNSMSWKENFKKEMFNKTVVASYNNNETYLIHDIEFNKNPTSSIQSITNKKPISYVEYFKKVILFNYHYQETDCFIYSSEVQH